MGYKIEKDLLKVDNTLFTFDIGDDSSLYFEIPEQSEKKDYTELKERIYKLNINNEEKANILNKISKLDQNISIKERKNIEKEINLFNNKYQREKE